MALTETTARALYALQQHNADPSRMTGETLANRIRAAARAAGLGVGFSGHSGCIGMARRMVAAGAPNAADIVQAHPAPCEGVAEKVSYSP